ncbi:hypothetical protein [Streptomyces lushanensis]|uniref:hypothetical protein n=1 Tax=Streptomyces lushanensis TaxID=1434255 RepID=UPI000D1B3D16|nr:hypothetical protein [Streptomyces lushanensis]
MNLRMTGLTAIVVFTALLPLAATTGPMGTVRPADSARPVVGRAEPLADAKVGAGLPTVSGTDGPAAEDSATDGTPVAGDTAGGTAGAATGDTAGGDAVMRADERCGPEVASPEGIEARTCVLTEGGDTWARTAYRNTSGGELRAVLTLMGPRGRTVLTHCVAGVTDEPATCQTPREPSRGTREQYTAVVEFAAMPTPSSGDDGEVSGPGTGPLLLRSGSNS